MLDPVAIQREPVHAALLELAAGQDDLLTSADILATGVHPDTMAKWVRRGHLRALHRGVYAPPTLVLTPRVVARAATLATGLDAATASHETAARVHGIGVLVLAGPPHVTIPERVHRRARPGLVLHRNDLCGSDVILLDGLRLTAGPRTVRDLLAGTSRLAAVWAGEAALRQGLTTEGDLDEQVAQWAGRPGGARMRMWRAAMDVRSESPLETAIRLVLRDAGLPAPVPQHLVRNRDGHVLARIDLAWPDHRLGLEADGKEPHGQPRPIYTDRWRNNALVGWHSVRFTWHDVLRRPAYVVATVRAHLAAAA